MEDDIRAMQEENRRTVDLLQSLTPSYTADMVERHQQLGTATSLQRLLDEVAAVVTVK